jgi:hypothetical protein
MRNAKRVIVSRVSFVQYDTQLRRLHIRRRAPSEEIFTRRREDVNDLRILGEETFVLDVAGNHCNIARNHRSPITPNAKIHPTLEHPNNLLVRVPVRSGMCARLHFPPDDHSLLAGNDTPLYNTTIQNILEAYFRDYEDHAANFRPIFLVNDIIRFWSFNCRRKSEAYS